MTDAAFALTGTGVNSFTATSGGNQGALIIDKSMEANVARIGSSVTFDSVTIDEGILDLNSFTLTSPVNVNEGGTLGGSGTVGNVIVSANGTVGPGTSPGLINTGNLTFASGAAFNAEINGPFIPGIDFDRVNVTGTLNLGGATLSTLGTVGANGSITIINNDGSDAVTGTFAGLAENDAVTINGNDFRISYAGGDGNDVILIRLPDLTPEPVTDVIITEVTNITSDNLDIPIGPPTTTPGSEGGRTPTSSAATVTNDFNSDSAGSNRNGDSPGTTSSPRVDAVQLIAQNTTQTPTPASDPAPGPGPGPGPAPQPVNVADAGAPPDGGGLFSSTNAPVVPATSVTPPPSGSAPQGPVSLGGGPPASTRVQTQITQSTNPQSQMELSSSLGLPPAAAVDSSEGPLAVGLGDLAAAPQTQASLGSAVSDSAFVELALAAGFEPTVSVQNTDGPGPLQPQAPPPTLGTRQVLSDAINPDAAQSLSLALGGDGTAPATAGDGPASVGIAGAPPQPETEASLESNISSGSASELFVALGGNGETTALPGSDPLTLDASGTPPSEQATESLQTAMSAQTESELSQGMGLTAEGIAQPTDGPLSTDFSGNTPSPDTAQSLQNATNGETFDELFDTINVESVAAGNPNANSQ